mgnify:CR=1 FL=1
MLIDTYYLSMKSACLMDTKEYLISSSNSLHFQKTEECSALKQNFTQYLKANLTAYLLYMNKNSNISNKFNIAVML